MTLGQPKLFNTDFAVKTSEILGCWLKEENTQSAGLSDAVLNEGNAAAEDQLGSPLCFKSLWLFSNICQSLVTCASLKLMKIKCSYSNCQVNDVLMLSWIATRLCQDAVRFGAAWLGRRELTDQWLYFSQISWKYRKNKGLVRDISHKFSGSCPWLVQSENISTPIYVWCNNMYPLKICSQEFW